MLEIKALEWLLLIICVVVRFGDATLNIKDIIGPNAVDISVEKELILDCDFDAEGEDDVVLKWFWDQHDDPIYQWIVKEPAAYALGPFKDHIDTTYTISDDPNSKLRALRFKQLNSQLSGNFTCKVDSNDDFKSLTKQVILYSPAEIFQISVVGTDDEYQGNEVILCNVYNVSPKPNFDIFMSGNNGTVELPDYVDLGKEEISDDDGLYNVSLRVAFNVSYLEPGTTKFICELSIVGTNYTQSKPAEVFVGQPSTSPPNLPLPSEQLPYFNCTEDCNSYSRENAAGRWSSILSILGLLLVIGQFA